ncbi:molybdenum cofactor sulfurase-like [Diadema antillarum]|uniref:molybdenum cofactor sulfurase-like n=1 Tax=Diadema antillarum TaxID=105358 RepID=UPI003A8BC85A
MLTGRRNKEFPQLRDVVYLDHTGATLPCVSQLDAFQRDLRNNLYGNPHSRSASSSLCSETVDQVRFRILKHFNTTAEKHTVIFTSGCTGALKLLAETFDWTGQTGSCSAGDGSTQSDHQNGVQCKDRQMGTFAYLQDNHTSVIGMREVAHSRGAKSMCFTSKGIQEAMNRPDGHSDSGNHSTAKDHATLHTQEATLSPTSQQRVTNGPLASSPCNLFAMPAQSNFCGRKYPLAWIERIKCKGLSGCHGNWYVVLDAAALVSTSPLDLSECKADFITISFYKMFGFPTGLGALIVRNSAANVLVKEYFGGGTVMAYLATENFNKPRTSVAERFEDGTIPFLDIISLRHGFDALDRLGGGMNDICEHTFTLAKQVHNALYEWKHDNGSPIAVLYCHNHFVSIHDQGPIINFNLLRATGQYIGYAEVERLAALHDIHLRTGCFCNTGACQQYLNISNEKIKANLDAGHVCGDDMDLIDGLPTGSIRISFGYMSNQSDVDRFLAFIKSTIKVSAAPSTLIPSSSTSSSDSSLKEVSRSSVLSTQSQLPMATAVLSSSTSTKSISSTRPSGIPDTCTSSESASKSSDCSPSASLSLAASSPPATSTSLSSPPISVPPESQTDIPMHGSDNTDAQFPQPSLNGNNLAAKTDSGISQTVQTSGPTEIDAAGPRLTAIYLYPVKSCGAMEVSEWELTDAGLKYDRRWMVVNEGGVYMSQKRIPKLCLIRPVVDLQTKQLVLTYPDMRSFSLPLETVPLETNETTLCQGKVCGDRVKTIDCGDEVAQWLTEVTGQHCRLQKQAEDHQRASKLAQGDDSKSSALSLANVSHYLLINKSSTTSLLNAIHQHAHEDNTETTTVSTLDNLIRRFRANLVVDGCDTYDEESWSELSIQGQAFKVKGRCNRCQMIGIDQGSGEKSTETLSALSAVRGKRIFFGMHIMNSPDLRNGFKLRTGDIIEVLQRCPSVETSV